ncbi:amidohydrolase [Bradyrhizobium sp. GM24.11]
MLAVMTCTARLLLACWAFQGRETSSQEGLGCALSLRKSRSPWVGAPCRTAGLLEGFGQAVGFHLTPENPIGMFGAREGAVTKSADQFQLTFTGRVAHGASPHDGVDAIVIAAAFINEVQKVTSREIPAEDCAVITIGTIRWGDATNIICPSVLLKGTIRTRSPERRVLLCQRVREVAEGIAATHRGRAEFVVRTREPPVVNDAGTVRRFNSLVEATLGKSALYDGPKRTSGSDDFGFYSACVPSIYFWIGSRAAGHESLLHTPTFGVPDDVLIPSVDLTARYLIDCFEA